MDPDVAPVCIIHFDQSSGKFRHNPEKWAEVRDQSPGTPTGVPDPFSGSRWHA
jgi:hypothetical protein